MDTVGDTTDRLAHSLVHRLKPIIKICGLTTDACVDACLAAGVETVGLNFYPGSPRCVTLEQAEALRARLPRPIVVVGVFVKPDSALVHEAVERVQLDVVQLHGTDLEYWRQFQPPTVPLWLAHGIASTDDIQQLKLQLKVCKAMNLAVTAALVDAKVAGQHGGTGERAPWSLLQQTYWNVPLILAGGLRPNNVREAIQQVQPAGVDVASGVEGTKARKDATLVYQFMNQARSAYHQLATSATPGE
ncbi:MAG: phosphoribosylanthranilate isomerase [Gemmatales bacterium]